MITVNTAGKSAKEAVEMTEAALNKQKDQDIQVLADDTMSAFEVKKILEHHGLDVLIQDDEGQMTLSGTHKKIQPVQTEQHEQPENLAAAATPEQVEKIVKEKAAEKIKNDNSENKTVFLIMGNSLGRGDAKLGGILIKGFLAGLVKSEPAPEAVILLNDGVKLALFDSSTCDHLKDLEARGTQLLISGICTSHFGITDSIGAGVIANIYEIVDVINHAGKVVCL